MIEDDLVAHPPSRAIEMDAVVKELENLRRCVKHKSAIDNEGKKLVIEVSLKSIECPICLESFSDALTLPCGHSLCTRHATSLRGICPICRAEFRGAPARNVVLCRSVASVVENVAKLQSDSDESTASNS